MAEQKQLSVTEYVEKLTGSILMDLQGKQSQGLVLPKSYAAHNALVAAMFKIKTTVDKDKHPALTVCKPDSIKQAVIEMLTKGLDPNKTQCYFIVYGDQLTLFESYFGLIHRAKEANPDIKDVYAEVVFEKDVISYSIVHGSKVITSHEQKPENIDLEHIKGAYSTIVYKDGSEQSEYMTFQQIKNSWARGQTHGASDAHKLSPEEMCKRTVLKRLVKPIINTENDEEVLNGQLDQINNNADANEASEAIDITPTEQDTLPETANQVDPVQEKIEEEPVTRQSPVQKTQPIVEKPKDRTTNSDQVSIEMPDILK